MIAAWVSTGLCWHAWTRHVCMKRLQKRIGWVLDVFFAALPKWLHALTFRIVVTLWQKCPIHGEECRDDYNCCGSKKYDCQAVDTTLGYRTCCMPLFAKGCSSDDHCCNLDPDGNNYTDEYGNAADYTVCQDSTCIVDVPPVLDRVSWMVWPLVLLASVPILITPLSFFLYSCPIQYHNSVVKRETYAASISLAVKPRGMLARRYPRNPLPVSQHAASSRVSRVVMPLASAAREPVRIRCAALLMAQIACRLRTAAVMTGAMMAPVLLAKELAAAAAKN